MVLLTVVSSLVMAATSICTESDPTHSPFIKGRVDLGTGISNVRWDSCQSGKVLFEQTCEGGLTVNCQDGCADGKCRAVGDVSTLITQCYDTDAKDDMYVKGTINSGVNLADTRVDYCYDKMTLFEQNCAGGKLVPCEFGCADGRCEHYGKFASKPEEQVCLDSDGGKDFFKKGIIAGKAIGVDVMEDYCLTPKILIEKTCEGNLKVECPAYCAQGKCKGSESTSDLKYEEVTSSEAGLLANQKKVTEEQEVEETEEVVTEEKVAEEAAKNFLDGKTWLWIAIIVIVIAIIYFSSTKKKKK